MHAKLLSNNNNKVEMKVKEILTDVGGEVSVNNIRIFKLWQRYMIIQKSIIE